MSMYFKSTLVANNYFLSFWLKTNFGVDEWWVKPYDFSVNAKFKFIQIYNFSLQTQMCSYIYTFISSDNV